MPFIKDRLAPDKDVEAKMTSPVSAIVRPVSGDSMPTSPMGSFMSFGGNSVPMRGILPVEQMTDTDLYRFYPYSAYADRMWSYTYYALSNRT